MIDLKLTVVGKKHRKEFYNKIKIIGGEKLQKQIRTQIRLQSKNRASSVATPNGFRALEKQVGKINRTWHNYYTFKLNRKEDFSFKETLLYAFYWDRSPINEVSWLNVYYKL